jgi:ribosome recycling factor
VAVEKQSGLSDKEKIQKILPILNERMDKISSRAGSNNLSKAEYYRAETKVNKMFKKVFREVKLA